MIVMESRRGRSKSRNTFTLGKREAVSKYYRREGRSPGVRDKIDYFIQVEDRLLGTLYCSREEAFSPEEMDERWLLIPVDEQDIPAKIRMALRNVALIVTMED